MARCCALLLSLAFAVPATAEELLVYVDDVAVAPETGLTPGGLSSSLCTALEKDKGLTVMCAAEVRGMLEMAGNVGALGQESPLVGNIMKRMAAVKFVIKPELHKTPEGGLKLLLRMFHAEAAEGGSVAAGRPAGRIVEISERGEVKKLLDRLPAAASRASAMLHEPRNTPGGPSDTPPPLEQKGDAKRAD